MCFCLESQFTGVSHNRLIGVDTNFRFVPEADIFFEPELAKFCQYQNR